LVARLDIKKNKLFLLAIAGLGVKKPSTFITKFDILPTAVMPSNGVNVLSFHMIVVMDHETIEDAR
jgi:hypothetical protein